MKITTASILLLLLGIIEAIIPQDFINNNLHQVVDITGAIVRTQTNIKIKTIAKKSFNYYISIADNNLSFISITQKNNLKETGNLCNFETNGNSIKVTLAEPMAKDQEFFLVVKSAFSQVLTPFPKVVAQNEPQFLKFTGNVYFYSPYKSEQQKTSFFIPKDRSLVSPFETESKSVAQNGNRVVCGPYKDVPAMSNVAISFHYANSVPILVASEFKKEAQISVLGDNLNVLEYYTLSHKGAELKNGQFSRIDYLMGGQYNQETNVVNGLVAHLPPNSFNVIYRDDIGNVSTSQLFYDFKGISLHLKPRYPLFGGWKYKWHHGYDVSLNSFLKKSGVEHTVSIPFLGSLKNVSYENAVLSISLPEGARDIKISLPFVMDSQSESITYTYLDTTGRPTLHFKKSNVVDEHNQLIKITYIFDDWRYFQKPLAVAFCFLSLFLALSFFSRLDLSISKDIHDENEVKLRTISDATIAIAGQYTKLHDIMTDSFETVKISKNFEAYRSIEKEVIETCSSLDKSLSEQIKSAGFVKESYKKVLENLESLLTERYSKTSSLQSAVLEFLKSDSKVDDKKKKDLSTKVEAYEKQMKSLNLKIEEVLVLVDFDTLE